MQVMTDAVFDWATSDERNGDETIEDELDDAWHRLAEARLLRATVASASTLALVASLIALTPLSWTAQLPELCRTGYLVGRAACP